MNISEFARGTERMVDPMLVGKTHYMQTKLKKLPTWIQRKIVTSATKKSGQMGFVVEPYCFFLFFELDDPSKVQKYLPKGFVPMKSAAFKGDTPRYYAITSLFRVHTSVFWGARAELYIVAENTNTHQMSWVILDYMSDTISYDHKHGLRSPDSTATVVTTTCEGKFLADFKNYSNNDHLIVEANLNNHTVRELDEQLWIEGNTSIAYGEELSHDSGDLFSLTFLPREMQTAWTIPNKDIKIADISCYPEIFGAKVAGAVCFPFAQHMLSDRPGDSTHYGSKAALEAAAKKVKFKG